MSFSSAGTVALIHLAAYLGALVSVWRIHRWRADYDYSYDRDRGAIFWRLFFLLTVLLPLTSRAVALDLRFYVWGAGCALLAIVGAHPAARYWRVRRENGQSPLLAALFALFIAIAVSSVLALLDAFAR